MRQDNKNNNEGRRVTDHKQKQHDDNVRLGHLEREMGGIKGEVGLLKVAMTDNSAKLSGMQEQMGGIVRAMEKVADRVHEPKQVNWGWMISAVMGIIIIAGIHAALVTQPLRDQTELNYELIRIITDDLRDVDRRLSFREGFSEGEKEMR